MTKEEMGMLAKVERDMDDGKQAFVVNEDARWAFPKNIIDECGI